MGQANSHIPRYKPNSKLRLGRSSSRPTSAALVRRPHQPLPTPLQIHLTVTATRIRSTAKHNTYPFPSQRGPAKGQTNSSISAAPALLTLQPSSTTPFHRTASSIAVASKNALRLPSQCLHQYNVLRMQSRSPAYLHSYAFLCRTATIQLSPRRSR